MPLVLLIWNSNHALTAYYKRKKMYFMLEESWLGLSGLQGSSLKPPWEKSVFVVGVITCFVAQVWEILSEEPTSSNLISFVFLQPFHIKKRALWLIYSLKSNGVLSRESFNGTMERKMAFQPLDFDECSLLSREMEKGCHTLYRINMYRNDEALVNW